MTKVHNIDENDFEAEVIQSDTPVLVDFWAPWCGPCKQIGPILEDIAQEKGDALKVVKVNVDDNQQLAGELRIQGIPTMFLMKDGKPIAHQVGALPKEQLVKWLDNNL